MVTSQKKIMKDEKKSPKVDGSYNEQNIEILVQKWRKKPNMNKSRVLDQQY